MKSLKKILTLILTMTVVSSLFVIMTTAKVSAAGVSISGANTVRAGDTITVTISISGPDAYGCQMDLFCSDNLTLLGISKKSPWSAFQASGNTFYTYDEEALSKPVSNAAVATAKFKVANGLADGTEIFITASGIVSVTPERNSIDVSSTFKRAIAKQLSGNNNLSSLTVSNAEISPAFAKGTLEYSCSVPFETEALDIKAKAEDGQAKISIENNALVPGANTPVNVKVTAPSGAVKTYVINTQRAQDPNYQPDTNNTLSNMTTENCVLSPAFSPDITEYVVFLPFETEQINILPECESQKATIKVSDNINALQVGENLVTVTVTSESGEPKEYRILVVKNDKYSSYEEYMEHKAVPAAEIIEDPVEPTVSSDKTMPMWVYILICFFCLVAGFFGALMIPKAKKDDDDDKISINDFNDF